MKRNGRDEEEVSSYSNAEGLRQQNLPVFLAQRQHHVTQNHHEAARDEKQAKVASIVNRTRNQPGDLEQKTLDGADPGYVGGRGFEQVAGLVVSLEDGKGVEQTPGVEEEHEARCDLEPCD